MLAVKAACKAGGFGEMYADFNPRPSLKGAGQIINFNRPLGPAPADPVLQELRQAGDVGPLATDNAAAEPGPMISAAHTRRRWRHKAAEHIAAVRGGAIYKGVQTPQEVRMGWFVVHLLTVWVSQVALFARLAEAHLFNGADTEYGSYEVMATEWAVVMSQDKLVEFRGGQIQYPGNVFFKKAANLKQHHTKLLAAELRHTLVPASHSNPMANAEHRQHNNTTIAWAPDSRVFLHNLHNNYQAPDQQRTPQVHRALGPSSPSPQCVAVLKAQTSPIRPATTTKKRQRPPRNDGKNPGGAGTPKGCNSCGRSGAGTHGFTEKKRHCKLIPLPGYPIHV